MHQLNYNYNQLEYTGQLEASQALRNGLAASPHAAHAAAARELPPRISTVTGLTFASLRPREELAQDAWLELRDRVLQQLDTRNISIEMLQYVERRVRFVCSTEHFETISVLADELGLSWRAVRHCVKLCIVGTGLRSKAGLFYRAAAVLREAGITLLHFGDSNATISLLVQQQDLFRAESLLRRFFSDGELTETRSIHFDADLARVRVNGIEKRLGIRQLKLLAFLLENAGQIVRAEEIADHLFGASGRDELVTLRVHVHNLRKKIEDNPNDPQYIMTVPNRGYLFVR